MTGLPRVIVKSVKTKIFGEMDYKPDTFTIQTHCIESTFRLFELFIRSILAPKKRKIKQDRAWRNASERCQNEMYQWKLCHDIMLDHYLFDELGLIKTHEKPI